jgi:hypothetical protein
MFLRAQFFPIDVAGHHAEQKEAREQRLTAAAAAAVKAKEINSRSVANISFFSGPPCGCSPCFNFLLAASQVLASIYLVF